MSKNVTTELVPLNVAVLTVSDTRTPETDTSGKLLASLIQGEGHHLIEGAIVVDDIYQIRAKLSQWIADNAVHCIITTGGTGFSGRDSTPEAVTPLLDKAIEGFGELFRQVSVEQIGTSTLQSRALGGIANGTLVFCLPGSNNACQTGWDAIIRSQIDSRHKPCNFVPHLKGIDFEACQTRS